MGGAYFNLGKDLSSNISNIATQSPTTPENVEKPEEKQAVPVSAPQPVIDIKYEGVDRSKAFESTASNMSVDFQSVDIKGIFGDKAPGGGALAREIVPKTPTSGSIDVVSNRDYIWTLSNINDVNEVPYVRLREYKIVDNSIKRGFRAFFSAGGEGGARFGTQTFGAPIDVYQSMWPKDTPTNFVYKFPYFAKTSYELASDSYTDIESIANATADVAKSLGLETFSNAINSVLNVSNIASNLANPSVNVTDRPKMFSGHATRTIKISFMLYNTLSPKQWMKHRSLIYILMSQNHFNKRDFINGVPPVFYDVYIPGQYYCWASYMSNISVQNVGNQRLLLDDVSKKHIVPDAYEIELTLTELVKASKNQFESLVTGEAEANIRVIPSQ